MTKEKLIQAVFNAVPLTYRSLTPKGDHIVELENTQHRFTLKQYATLEKLSMHMLQKIADQLKINYRVEALATV